MNILIFSLGTTGDINPLIGIGASLLRLGHKVTFLSNDYFSESIREAGLEFISVGTIEQYRLGYSPESWESNNEDAFEFYHAPSFEPAFNYVKDFCKTHDAGLLLTQTEYNGACAAAHHFKLPFIKVILSPNLIFSTLSPPAPYCWIKKKSKLPLFAQRFIKKRNRNKVFKQYYGGQYAAHYVATRKRLGVPLRFIKDSNARLQIGLFPEWFGMRAKDWPKNLKLVGFPMHDRVNHDARKEVDSIIAKHGAPIVFTTGTGMPDTTELFTEGRKICELLNLPGIFVGGHTGKEVLAGSALCFHIDYVDFDYSLPKCKAIVHHGGIGTTAQAIKAKIPQIIRPIKYDQPDNGNRIKKLGLGTFIFRKQFVAENVAPLMKDLIEHAIRNNALSNYSADVKRNNTIEKVCRLIEQTILELKYNEG
jgi:rhamnosyltransferase subunit B